MKLNQNKLYRIKFGLRKNKMQRKQAIRCYVKVHPPFPLKKCTVYACTMTV